MKKNHIVFLAFLIVIMAGVGFGIYRAYNPSVPIDTTKKQAVTNAVVTNQAITEAIKPSSTVTPTATATPQPTATQVPQFLENVVNGSLVNDEASFSYMSEMEVRQYCPEKVRIRNSELSYGTLSHHTYTSISTGLERGVNVLVPAGYSDEKQYPVLYLLHGIFGNEYSFTSDSSMKLDIILGNLIANGEANDMIVVFPDMFAKTDPMLQPGFNEESYLAYDNFIHDLVHDLIPFIEETYSVAEGRANRAIAGFSMGGRESLFIGITRPDLFAYCAAFAPAPGLTPGVDFGGNHKGQLTEEELFVKDMENMPYILMINCGTNDSVVGKFPLSYHNALVTNQVNHLWYEVGGADHDTKTVQSGFYNYVRYLFRAEPK